jgi:inosine-uridine nucleoside N-ribohydrolase
MGRMPRTRIVVDTDPGQDDAVALLLALAEREALDVLGITTVAGNVPLPLTTSNALRIVELARRDDVAVMPARASRCCASSRRPSSSAAPTASKAPDCRRRASPRGASTPSRS